MLDRLQIIRRAKDINIGIRLPVARPLMFHRLEEKKSVEIIQKHGSTTKHTKEHVPQTYQVCLLSVARAHKLIFMRPQADHPLHPHPRP